MFIKMMIQLTICNTPKNEPASGNYWQARFRVVCITKS
jgi:hypothetical protein